MALRPRIKLGFDRPSSTLPTSILLRLCLAFPSSSASLRFASCLWSTPPSLPALSCRDSRSKCSIQPVSCRESEPTGQPSVRRGGKTTRRERLRLERSEEARNSGGAASRFSPLVLDFFFVFFSPLFLAPSREGAATPSLCEQRSLRLAEKRDRQEQARLFFFRSPHFFY